MNDSSSHGDLSTQQEGTDEAELEYHLKDAVNSLSFNARVASFAARDRLEDISLPIEEKREIARRYVAGRSKGGTFDLGDLHGEFEEKGRMYQKLFEELAADYAKRLGEPAENSDRKTPSESDANLPEQLRATQAAVNGSSYCVGEIDLLNALIGLSVSVDVEIENAEQLLRTKRLDELKSIVHTTIERASKFAQTLRKESLTRDEIGEHAETFLETDYGKEVMGQLLLETGAEVPPFVGPRTPLHFAFVPDQEFNFSSNHKTLLISQECRRLEQQLKHDIDSLIEFGIVLKLPTNR